MCPSRLARRENRRFFLSRESAEASGYRACQRCRPELVPGEAPVDAVPRLAQKAAEQIAAGALNGRSVKALATDLGMSERHLRRALGREIGASPFHLALTQRLHTAARSSLETGTPVTRVYASGFRVCAGSTRLSGSTFRCRRASGGGGAHVKT